MFGEDLEYALTKACSGEFEKGCIRLVKPLSPVCLAEIDTQRGRLALGPLLGHYEEVKYDDEDDDDDGADGGGGGNAAGAGGAPPKMNAAAKQAEKEKRAVLKKLEVHRLTVLTVPTVLTVLTILPILEVHRDYTIHFNTIHSLYTALLYTGGA
jgi:hypothetical protein